MSVIVTSKRFCPQRVIGGAGVSPDWMQLTAQWLRGRHDPDPGALGKQITQKLCRIDMTAGNYLLQFEATKPGMAIDWLGFRQVTD